MPERYFTPAFVLGANNVRRPIPIRCLKKRGHPEKMETVGDQIKTARLDLGLFQKDVARLLGVETSTIIGWERNNHLPHISRYPKIAKFLGHPPIEPIVNQEFSSNELRSLRLKAGLTQKLAANFLGIHYSTLSEY